MRVQCACTLKGHETRVRKATGKATSARQTRLYHEDRHITYCIFRSINEDKSGARFFRQFHSRRMLEVPLEHCKPTSEVADLYLWLERAGRLLTRKRFGDSCRAFRRLNPFVLLDWRHSRSPSRLCPQRVRRRSRRPEADTDGSAAGQQKLTVLPHGAAHLGLDASVRAFSTSSICRGLPVVRSAAAQYTSPCDAAMNISGRARLEA